MAGLEICVNGASARTIEIAAADCIIGRGASAHVVLESPFVSTQHAKIHRNGVGYELEDLNSRNGILINGRKLAQKTRLQHHDLIEIGDCKLTFLGEEEPETRITEPQTKITAAAPAQPVEPRVEAPSSREEEDHYLRLKTRIRERLLERMNLKKLSSQATSDAELRRMTEERLEDILREFARELPAAINRARLKKEILDDTLGLGPLEDLLEEESISELMVNGWNRIYVESRGKLQLSAKKFIDDAHVMAVIQRIVAPVGRAINESSPLVDARLKDGSRVNAIIPPLALTGPTLTIRKFSKRRLTTDDLIGFGSVNHNMVEFLKLAVRERMNVVISGGTGSGKTTLLNILSSFIPNQERIVTVEDAAELRLDQDHIVSLETRPANMEGSGAITIRDLVKNCLRMRPDRIVVGECRGGEALDMLQAMNTGHDGSLTTAHANSPRDVISRLETMVLMSGMDLPVRAIREQIASAVNLIVQQSRMPDGSRKVTHVTEVTGIEGEKILLQDIFIFAQKGFDANGKVVGEFKATGLIPNFVQKLTARGIQVDLEIFRGEEH